MDHALGGRASRPQGAVRKERGARGKREPAWPGRRAVARTRQPDAQTPEAAETIAGLLTLARAEGFFALPTQSVEEPVVPKQARVTGAVRVGKTAETATRAVGDEVRTEEVEGLCPCHREHRPRRPAAWRRTCSPGDAVVRLGSPGAT
jgi:hypothetical protein